MTFDASPAWDETATQFIPLTIGGASSVSLMERRNLRRDSHVSRSIAVHSVATVCTVRRTRWHSTVWRLTRSPADTRWHTRSPADTRWHSTIWRLTRSPADTRRTQGHLHKHAQLGTWETRRRRRRRWRHEDDTKTTRRRHKDDRQVHWYLWLCAIKSTQFISHC